MALCRANNFTVARVKRNILSHSDVGVPVHQPPNRGSPTTINRTFGADVNLQFFTDLKF